MPDQPNPQRISVDEKAHHLGRLADRVAAREKALDRARREQDALDALVAELVSEEPTSPTWYRHPGRLTPEEVQSGASLTELGLDKTMARYRKTTTAKTTKRPRARSSR